VTNSDSYGYGDVYLLTAMKTDTRLFISHHEGSGKTDGAIDLFRDVGKKRSIYFSIPVVASDN
jgi:hypothetical protein